MDAIGLSRALGWFSVALGTVEVLAGRHLGHLLGMDEKAGLLRLFGLREIGVGLGILARPERPELLWARVGGDVLDLAALSAGLRAGNPYRGNVDAALAMVAGITLLDILCGYRLQERQADRTRLGFERRARLAGAV